MIEASKITRRDIGKRVKKYFDEGSGYRTGWYFGTVSSVSNSWWSRDGKKKTITVSWDNLRTHFGSALFTAVSNELHWADESTTPEPTKP